MDLEKLIIKRDKIKEELDKLNDKIDLLTPIKVSLYYSNDYDCKAEYFCPNCGVISKKYCKKHKCGQMLDWSELIDDENKRRFRNE